MKVWLPYTRGGSGTDVFTCTLADALCAAGHGAVPQAFSHNLQYFPWALSQVKAPPGTDVVLANSWNGFVFRRQPLPLVTVEHLFILDPALRPYRSFAQSVFHETLVRYYENASMRASDIQVAVSEYTANAHQEVLGGPKPHVILNGADTHYFAPSPSGKAPLVNRPLRLLFVGNLTRRKGVDLIPPIMRELGEGFELEYAVGRRTADCLTTLPNARGLGRLNREELRAAYRRADLLLFPTRLEGLPLVAIEAMACGTPAVASRCSSLPEVIDDGVNGCLCPLDHADAFIATIRGLAENPDSLTNMGRAARETALTKFSFDRMLGEYWTLLSSLKP